MTAAALLKRLDKVESTIYDDTGRQRSGVLLVPAIEHDLDRWSERAMAQQAALAQAVREDTSIKAVDKHTEPLPKTIKFGKVRK